MVSSKGRFLVCLPWTKRRIGTCYCPNANFGRNYCEMEPRWYHTDGNGRAYKGDRHPEEAFDFPEDAFEPEPRACGNCGQVAKMLKKEYC